MRSPLFYKLLRHSDLNISAPPVLALSFDQPSTAFLNQANTNQIFRSAVPGADPKFSAGPLGHGILSTSSSYIHVPTPTFIAGDLHKSTLLLIFHTPNSFDVNTNYMCYISEQISSQYGSQNSAYIANGNLVVTNGKDTRTITHLIGGRSYAILSSWETLMSGTGRRAHCLFDCLERDDTSADNTDVSAPTGANGNYSTIFSAGTSYKATAGYIIYAIAVWPVFMTRTKVRDLAYKIYKAYGNV